MRRGSDHDRARTRLRLGIGLFVLALAAPSLLLVHKAYDQIKWESFRQQQLAAEGLAERIDQTLAALARVEDARPIEDYDFLTESRDRASPYRQRSPLSAWPVSSPIPGLIGWFQVAADGTFSSPLVPDAGLTPTEHGIGPADLAHRQALTQRIQGILIGNRLVERGARETEHPPPAPAASQAESTVAPQPIPPPTRPMPAKGDGLAAEMNRPREFAPALSAVEDAPSRLSQAAFERLASERIAPTPAPDKGRALGRVDDLKLDLELAERGRRKDETETKSLAPATAKGALQTGEEGIAAAPPPAPASRAPQTPTQAATAAASAPSGSVRLFTSTVEPCEVGRLDSGHLLLFRTVWRAGERWIQGVLIEQSDFLEGVIGAPLAATTLARTTHLIVAYRGEVLSSFRAEPRDDYARHTARLVSADPPPLTGALLYRARMPEPFGGLELIFTVSRLPTPAGAAAIGWMAAVLALVLLAGSWLMYRLGMRQLELIRQQQDFVSAVSHELKTPLTSIRMYAEMLRAGFATEERKATYYRFIQEESERLSRLIANVLQLARIGRDALVLEARIVPIHELMDRVLERVAGPIERAGFELELNCDSTAELLVDPDAFVQILINLVDNALKFTASAETRRIRIGCEALAGGQTRVSVRDFGPGIPRDQRKRIFQLFQRGAEAKRQAIPGTGIGLALVQRLTQAMGGKVEVTGADPGAEFRLEFPLARRAPTARA